ncbi:MAG: hypothetical protein AAF533_13960 [Acidobacteriota bacterium]
MPLFRGKQIELKLVYYGPAMCGKTTNLEQLHELLKPELRGKLMSMNNVRDDRTIFFDLLPLNVPFGNGYTLSAQLYTVPGQVAYNHTRKMVLQGVDGLVFVADSQPSAVKANAFSFQNLMNNLEELKVDGKSMPLVVQFNKRDLPGVRPMEELTAAWKARGVPCYPAIASKGEGVLETLVGALRKTFRAVVRSVPQVHKAGLNERAFLQHVLVNFQLPKRPDAPPSQEAQA